MTAPAAPASLWRFLSREVALVCDASGTLTWWDDRATRRLEAGPGKSLRALAAQGTEDKVDRLITLARDERVERWEAILCVGGMPRTFAFRGAPHEGGVALVGSLVPEGYAASLPDLIFLDFVPPDMPAFDVLDERKADPRTRDLPVIIHTSRQLQEEERQRLVKGTSTILAKHRLSREVAITHLRDALHTTGPGTEESRRG